MQKHKSELGLVCGLLLENKMKDISKKFSDTAKNIQNIGLEIHQLIIKSIVSFDLFSSKFDKLYTGIPPLMLEISTCLGSMISQYNKASDKDNAENLERIENSLKMLENKYAELVKLKTDIKKIHKVFKTAPACEQDQNQKQK